MRRLGLFILLLIVPSAVEGTSGGPEVVNVLGYSETEGRVYCLTYYQDESGRLPELSYIDFSNDAPSDPIPFESFAADLDGPNRKEFFVRIKSLRATLVRLQGSEADRIELSVQIVSTKERVLQDDLPPVFEYEMEVTLKNGNLIGTQGVTGYINRKIGVSQWLKVPKTRYGLAVFTYTGIPYEGGYLKDSVMILGPSDE